jgi:hypothetical protein
MGSSETGFFRAPLVLGEMTQRMTITALPAATEPARNKSRVLSVACAAHALHDGLTDTLYLLLPLWQAQFALSYAAIGVLRALYAGAMEQRSGDARTHGLVAVMKLPIGDVVQKCRQLDDEGVRGSAACEALRHFPDAISVPPIVARALPGKPFAYFASDTADDRLLIHVKASF